MRDVLPVADVAAEIAANKAAAKLRAKRQAANRLKELDGDLGFLASEEAMKAPCTTPLPGCPIHTVVGVLRL